MNNGKIFENKVFFLLLILSFAVACNSESNKNTDKKGNGSKNFSITNKTNWEKIEKEKFSILYPPKWEVEKNQPTGIWSSFSADVEGQVVVVISSPKEYLTGTNFGGVKISVAKSSKKKAVANCLAPVGNRPIAEKKQVTVNGTEFMMIQAVGAATGDRYITKSYRTRRGEVCWVVESILNYSPMGFYGKESEVDKFDREKVKNIVQKIVKSFHFKV